MCVSYATDITLAIICNDYIYLFQSLPIRALLVLFRYMDGTVILKECRHQLKKKIISHALQNKWIFTTLLRLPINNWNDCDSTRSIKYDTSKPYIIILGTTIYIGTRLFHYNYGHIRFEEPRQLVKLVKVNKNTIRWNSLSLVLRLFDYKLLWLNTCRNLKSTIRKTVYLKIFGVF